VPESIPHPILSASIHQLLTSDGRLVKKPTYKTLKKLLDPLKTVIKLDSNGKSVRKFSNDTEIRLLEVVVRIGFNPIIYLEKFTPKMDLWSYH